MLLHSFIIALAAILALTATARADPVDDARAETEAHLARAADGTPLCFPPIAGPVEVHAARLRHQGEPATSHKVMPFRYADLRVEATKQPALIILTSHGPTVWRIDATSEARIAAVLTAGSGEALVTGLPEGVLLTRGYFLTRSGDKVSCGKPPSRDAIEAADHERQNILDQLRCLRERIAMLRSERQGLDRAIRAVENAMPEAAALDVLRVELVKVQDERADLLRKSIKLLAAKRELEKSRPSPQELINKEKDALSLLDGGPPAIERGLAFFGDFTIASYQEIRSTSSLIISDAVTSEFAELKRGGERDLASIVEPEFPVLQPDAPSLTPPVDLIGQDAIDYLVERGYLLADSEKAANYVCRRFDAAYRALGLTLDRCGYGRHQAQDYVVLGPFVLEPSQCLGVRTLYLPTGAPEPTGKACKDLVVRLGSELCTVEITECTRRGGITLR